MNTFDFADLSTDQIRYQLDIAERGQAAIDLLFGGPNPLGYSDHDRRPNVAAPARRLAPDYFTPAEIAQYLGLSAYTVQEVCRRGTLRHVLFGRSIRIRRQWADQFMAALERQPLQ